MANYYNNDPFNQMDDLFNQLMGNMNGFNSEKRRYMVNGRELTPEEIQIYRQTASNIYCCTTTKPS